MAHDEKTMVCMEVWGGCEPVDAAVKLDGLDAWVYSKPYQDADGGGDVYYVSACASGRINRLLVADVSGHGEGVREIAVDLRNLMRRYVNYLDQSRFVVSMNRQFVESSSAGIFATAVVTTFFAPTRTLSICNAGHPQPLVYHSKTGTWTLLDKENEGKRCVNIPLGILDLEECEQFGVELDVGDLVLVYTDSLIEARGVNGEMLGTRGLLDLVRRVVDVNKPGELVATVLKAICEETGTALTADDVTMLLLRPNGTGKKTPFLTRMMAPIRLLAALRYPLTGRGPWGFPEVGLVTWGGNLFSGLNQRWGRRREG